MMTKTPSPTALIIAHRAHSLGDGTSAAHEEGGSREFQVFWLSGPVPGPSTTKASVSPLPNGFEAAASPAEVRRAYKSARLS